MVFYWVIDEHNGRDEYVATEEEALELLSKIRHGRVAKVVIHSKPSKELILNILNRSNFADGIVQIAAK